MTYANYITAPVNQPKDYTHEEAHRAIARAIHRGHTTWQAVATTHPHAAAGASNAYEWMFGHMAPRQQRKITRGPKHGTVQSHPVRIQDRLAQQMAYRMQLRNTKARELRGAQAAKQRHYREIPAHILAIVRNA